MAEEKARKQGFFKFIISKKFIIQLGIALGLVIVMFWVLTRYLSVYTDHGHELVVPDFNGLTLEQIDSAGFTKNFDFYVIDSLYDDNNQKGG